MREDDTGEARSPRLTFFREEQPIDVVADMGESTFESDRVRVGKFEFYLTGSNIDDYLIVEEDSPSIFLNSSGVFEGPAGDMDVDDKPFVLEVMVEPAPEIPMSFRLRLPNGVNLEGIIEDVDVECPEDSFGMAPKWKKIAEDGTTDDEIEYDLFSIADPKVLNKLEPSIRAIPPKLE